MHSLYVLVTFMSAAIHTPAPATDPDPPRPGAAMPPALGRVLNVIRRLIDYGRLFAATLQQRAAAPDFASFARPFGTTDLAATLARIIGGLRRAAALEAALCRRAATGRDLTPSPVRMPAAGDPRAPRLVAPPAPEPANQT